MQLLVRLFVVLVTLLGVAPVAKGADLVPGEALKHVGERARICGHVSSAKYAQSVRGAPTFLNFGRPYPNQDFTAVVWGTARPRFSSPPETLKGQEICVSGIVSTYKDKAQIEVSDPGQIQLRNSQD
jgi:hypothetical protein